MLSAKGLRMRTIFFLFFLCCRTLEAPILPEALEQPGTLLFREHFVVGGVERTGNWWYRFDGRGCYTQGYNTWLWIHDPVLKRSTERSLHFNDVVQPRVWFCLSARQRAKLIAAVRKVRAPPKAENEWSGPVDRWTLQVGTRTNSIIVPGGRASALLRPVLETLSDLAREGVWGQSPQVEAGGWLASSEKDTTLHP
jgi:hypothetical protein